MEDGVPELQAADRQVCGVHLQAGFPDNAGSLREGRGGCVWPIQAVAPPTAPVITAGIPAQQMVKVKKKIFFKEPSCMCLLHNYSIIHVLKQRKQEMT